MATTGVSGSNPIRFTDANNNQLLLPLSALSIGPNGLVVTGWAPYLQNKATVDPLVAQLYASGILTAAPAPVTKRALFVQAAIAGSNGNNITISVVSPSPGNADITTFDITVTETDVYGGLSVAAPTTANPNPAFLGTVLGDGNTVKPTMAGLVVLPSPQTGVSLPAATPAGQPLVIASPPLPAPTIPPPATPPVPGPPIVAVPKNTGSGTAFTLQARAGLPAGSTFTAAISNVDPVANTFSLTVVWTLKIPGIKVSALATALTSVLVVQASVDNPGGILQPATATITLSGGQDGTTPNYAGATLLAL